MPNALAPHFVFAPSYCCTFHSLRVRLEAVVKAVGFEGGRAWLLPRACSGGVGVGAGRRGVRGLVPSPGYLGAAAPWELWRL